ncbi:hypothetical protein BJX61DRAFT_539691 [Aspergillus egyptiacus]|nr:hypothetical protein BJX61DRAFT_539691 [Aspergillus egyptiacus]
MTEPRRRWTAAEDALLWELYQIQEKAPTGKCQKINWNEIARNIPGRSNKDCRKRYYNRFTGGLRKGSWTQDEDERLFQLVERYGCRWATIAQKMETRNADQCSKRWHHCLNPELERSPWTDEENYLLLSAVRTHGSSWKDIQRCHFPTRSANNIKNQYTILSRKSLSPISRHPCCDAITSLSPSHSHSHASTSIHRATASSSASAYHTRTPSHDAYASAYASNSLSSTAQVSASEYLPATPDTSAMTCLDFQTPMSLGGDPCGYFPNYQSATAFYPNANMDLSGTPDLVACESSGMGYLGGASHSTFPNGMVDQGLYGYQGGHGHGHGHGSFGF